MKKLLYLILAFTFAFLLWNNHRLSEKLKTAYSKNAELEEELNSKVVVSKDKIVYVYRDKETPKQKEVYVPPMGDLEIKTPKEEKVEGNTKPVKVTCSIFQKKIETENSIICVTNKGFGIKPGLGAFMAKEPEVSFNLSLAYWGRYVGGVGFGHRETAFIYSGRHISDILDFAPNTFIMGGFGYNLKDQDKRILLGLGIHF